MEGCHHPPKGVDVGAQDVQITFHWKEHAERLVRGLMDMFFHGCHVDMDVKFGGEYKWKVHRLVLSVFLPCVRDSIAAADLNLNDVAEEIDDVRALIEFVYSGHLKLRKERAEPLRRLADRLNFKDLSNALVKLCEHDGIPVVSMSDKASTDDEPQPSTLRSPSIIDVDDYDDDHDMIANDIVPVCDQPEEMSIVSDDKPSTAVEVQAQDNRIISHAEMQVETVNQELHDKVQVHVGNHELDVEVPIEESVTRDTSVCPEERTKPKTSEAVNQELHDKVQVHVDNHELDVEVPIEESVTRDTSVCPEERTKPKTSEAVNQELHDKVQVHVDNHELDVEVPIDESVTRDTSVCPDERTKPKTSEAVNQELHDKVQVHVDNHELDVEVPIEESVTRDNSVCPDERKEPKTSVFPQVEQRIESIIDDLVAADSPQSSCSSENWETSDCGSDDDDVPYLAKKAPFKCLLCPWIFSSKIVARCHFKKVHPEVKLFECQHCDFDVVHENTLKAHIELFHKPRSQTLESIERVPSKCQLCSRTFSEKTYLNNHIWLRHMAPPAVLQSGAMRCILCPQFVCADRYDLRQHFFKNHVDGKMLKCGSCEFFAATENQLQLHVKRLKHFSSTIGIRPNTIRQAKVKAAAFVKAALQETSEDEDEERGKRPRTAPAESVEASSIKNVAYVEDTVSIESSVQESPGDSTDKVNQPDRSVIATEKPVEKELSVKAAVIEASEEELPENSNEDNKPIRCPLCNFKYQKNTSKNDQIKSHVKLVHPENILLECNLCEFWTINSRFMDYHHDENHAPSTAGVTARKTSFKFNRWATRKTCHAVSFASARRQMREVPVEVTDDENSVVCRKCDIMFSCHTKLVTHNRIIHHVNTKSLKRKSRARLPPAKLNQGE